MLVVGECQAAADLCRCLSPPACLLAAGLRLLAPVLRPSGCLQGALWASPGCGCRTLAGQGCCCQGTRAMITMAQEDSTTRLSICRAVRHVSRVLMTANSS